MIEQVAGRAGRKHKQGIVCIQTSEPRHPIIQYAVAHDYLGFIKNELEERRHFGYPPFTRIINIYIKHRDDNSLTEMSVRFSNMLREVFGRRVLGPKPGRCPYSTALYPPNCIKNGNIGIHAESETDSTHNLRAIALRSSHEKCNRLL